MPLHLILVCFVFLIVAADQQKKSGADDRTGRKVIEVQQSEVFPVFCFFSIEFLSHGREFALVVQAQVADRWHFGGGCHFMEFFRICDGNNVKSRIRRLFKGSGSCTRVI